MDHRSMRRARSPPYSYDPRPSVRDLDSPYNSFDGPPRHTLNAMIGQPLPPPPHGLQDVLIPPFMEQEQRHNYAANFRENRLPSTYRHTIRDHYQGAGPPPRSSSPSYKILCITNINNKIDDNSVKNALMSDFSRFGDISVSICHDSGERLAYIYFRSYLDAREARTAKTRTLFFDRPIEVEPIYEQNDASSGEGPSPPHQPGMMSQQPVYSPKRRRSISPSDYPPDTNMHLMNHRRQAMPSHIVHASTPPIPPLNHGPVSPTDVYPPLNRASGYGPTPPPMMGPDSMHPAHDRRSNLSGQHPPSNHMSPYSTPPHDPYRNSYPLPVHHYSTQPTKFSGPPLQTPSASPLSGRSGRDRLYGESNYMSPQSPHPSDPYHQPEIGQRPGGPTSAPYQLPSRSSSHYSSRHRPSPDNHHLSSSRPVPAYPHHGPAYRHRPQQDSFSHHYPSHQHASMSRRHDAPPARYMSREFRRERYGIVDSHSAIDRDEGRPSRVLLVNNIDSSKTENDLRDMFEPMGIIEEIEIKKISSEISSALIRFSSMDGAYKAKTANQGRHIGNTKCSIVYGKISASRRLWIGGLSSSTTLASLEDECSKYGDLVTMDYTTGRPYSYVEYETPNQAQFAAYHLKSSLVPAPDRKIRVEFVDPERSEKMSRQETNSQVSETKSRITNDSSWASNDRESSPPSNASGIRKRSNSPDLEASSKRTCQLNELLPGANTFKQERLLAAAAAKARTSSTASSNTDRPIDGSQEAPSYHATITNNSRTGNGNSSKLNNNSSAVGLDSAEELQYEAPNVEVLARCSSISEIVSNCAVSWPSQIALRNFIFPSRIYLCSGRKQVIDKSLIKASSGIIGSEIDQACPLLKITQRWRMHPQPKLEEVKKRMQSGNLGILIITARQESTNLDLSTSVVDNHQQQTTQNGDDRGGDNLQSNKTSFMIDNESSQPQQSMSSLDKTNSSVSYDKNHQFVVTNNVSSIGATNSTNNNTIPASTKTSNSQSRPLRNLISYLEQKDAAGVISLGGSIEPGGTGEQTPSNAGCGSDSGSKLLYAFPPGEFALNLIKHIASNLTPEISKEEFLLGVIVGSNVEGKA